MGEGTRGKIQPYLKPLLQMMEQTLPCGGSKQDKGHKEQLGGFRSDVGKSLFMRRVIQCWNSSTEMV